MSRTLILVESGHKGRQIEQYLGREYTVKPTGGHICDLPKEYGVDLESGTFAETYVPRDDKTLARLKGLLSQQWDRIVIASDPDREGEAIAWHVARMLKLRKGSYERVTFNAITEPVIRQALANPRDIAIPLVDAQRTRRILDRIVGYDVSGEVVQKIGARSAGRVQSYALHVICQRERDILNFVTTPYFTLDVNYAEGLGAFVPAKPTDDFGPQTDPAAAEGAETGGKGKKKANGRLTRRWYRTREDAEGDQRVAEANAHIVRKIDKKRVERAPDAPYATADVLADAHAKLGLSVEHTTELLQTLYETGWITYHRTDSHRVDPEFHAMAREFIAREHPECLPAKPPIYPTKASAQDGHTAICPNDLDRDAAGAPEGSEDLYRMIRARFLASQSKPAIYSRTIIWIDSGPVEWAAEGVILLEPGYLTFWRPYARQKDVEVPALREGQTLTPEKYAVESRQTPPPSRFTEATLVKYLEKMEVGRPSTYNKITSVLSAREYVRTEKGMLRPTEQGMNVDDLLLEVIPDLVTREFTANMEESLDEISRGELGRVEYLTGFYGPFRSLVEQARPRVKAFCEARGLKPRSGGPNGKRGEETKHTCERCGAHPLLKITPKGKSAFLACEDREGCGFVRDVRAKVKPGACKAPGCGGTLVERKARPAKGQKGKGNSFFACSRAGCRYTENAEGKARAASNYTYEETQKKCPRCEKTMLAAFRAREAGPAGERRDLYACPDRDGCNFMLTIGSKASEMRCPECGGIVLERMGPKGRYWACARWLSRKDQEALKESARAFKACTYVRNDDASPPQPESGS